ncbi:MAG: AraC family transcriptional regulator [Eubacterium sp.]|nr:AraC family transcriptional regulator [Eubacterium sp.]
MYHSESFYIDNSVKQICFTPDVSSAFKILADNGYCHICNYEEKASYSEKTIAFIRCTTGKGRIEADGKSFILKENEYIFISFHCIEKYKSLSHLWGYEWVNFETAGKYEFELNKIYTSNVIEEEILAFDKLISAGKEADDKDYINFLFLNLYYIITKESGLYNNTLLKTENIKLIDEICAFIQQKLFEKITVNDVALFFNITPRRLHQIFSKELGISPKQYLVKKKMEEGYRLLVQTSYPINKISEALSFSSAYHFSNEFKKIFNQTPTQVRNME